MKKPATSEVRPVDEFGDLRQELERYTVKVVVTHADSYRAAVELRADAKAYLAKVKLKFAPIIEAAVAAVNRTRNLLHEVEDPAVKLIDQIDQELSAFERRQEDERKREEIQLARDQEEQDRTRRLLEVEHLRRTGYVGDAKALAAEPLPPAIVPTLPVATPKIEGFQKRTLWEHEIYDLAAFRKAYRAEGSAIPDEAMVPNPAFLNALARASKSTLAIPGVKAVSKTVRAQGKV